MQNISWYTHEYLHTEKHADWYWIVGIVTVSVALISIILGNVIFAILIIVSAFTLSLFGSKKPDVVKIEITNRGVSVGSSHYPYKYLESFWIETQEHYPRVLLKSKKVFMPLIKLIIDDVDPEEIHRVLAQHLPEEEHTEPLLEKLFVHFGF